MEGERHYTGCSAHRHSLWPVYAPRVAWWKVPFNALKKALQGDLLLQPKECVLLHISERGAGSTQLAAFQEVLVCKIGPYNPLHHNPSDFECIPSPTALHQEWIKEAHPQKPNESGNNETFEDPSENAFHQLTCLRRELVPDVFNHTAALNQTL